MRTVLCTLYNSLYLDKGLVLYDSLCACAKDFKLYVLCMDDKCYDVLKDLKQEHHIPVRSSDFEKGDAALLEAKGNRPMGEYCWTCSSSFIRYVLKHYGEESCTYIDADMYFYNDPKVLIDEMLEARKSVMVVPHRFSDDKKDLAKSAGTYCVEFNVFLNTSESLKVLEYWRERCLECCSALGDGIHYGDQKYLEELVVKYDCVHQCNHLGAGIAPWNISLYRSAENSSTTVVFKSTGQWVDVVFYHYQNLNYITRKRASTGIFARRMDVDYILVDRLYYNYMCCLDEKKQWLSDVYGINILIKSHPAFKEPLGIKAWLCRTLAFKILRKLHARINGTEEYFINIA